MLATAPGALKHFEQVAVAAPPAPVAAPAAPPQADVPRRPDGLPHERREPTFEAGVAADAGVDEDVQRLSMSTLSFQDYVRERMLRRRQAELAGELLDESADPLKPGRETGRDPGRDPGRHLGREGTRDASRTVPGARLATAPGAEALRSAAPTRAPHGPAADATPRAPTMPAAAADPQAAAALQRERAEMMTELRSMKGLIEDRFGALAFMEKLQREPRQAQLTQRLLEGGFSPALIRKLVTSLPAEGDEMAWATHVLARNLQTGQPEPALEDVGGVWALIGSTGVGKTTSTAKLAATFAAKHGASQLGLITLDAYRMGAQEQLRAYGRILGVPVHTAHDRASLEDLLELLSGKKMVLIDTAGVAQRDARAAELLDMLSHPSIQRLLVINASAQGETIDDVASSWRAANCRGVVLTKVDEAVKLGPALDALIRHRLKVLAVANGQRVPEDWHRLSSQTLVQRALRATAPTAWRMDPSDVNLVFAGAPAAPAAPVAPVR